MTAKGDYWEENGLTKPQEVIVAAANRYTSCYAMPEGTLLVGARHWDTLMRSQLRLITQERKLTKPNEWEQGFINQFGEFRNREEALKIVLESGQPFDKERNRCTMRLYSEGLY